VTHKRHILVVDDDPSVVATLEASLEDDYQVVGVGDGQAALDAAASGQFEVIVLDVEMPIMNGYETCERLRADPAAGSVAVIFHSAHGDIAERLRGYAAGGDDFLSKPFDPDELKAKIFNLLARRDRQKEVDGQLEDMTNTALATADMVGEVGVVLDFQRQLAETPDYPAVARLLLDALHQLGLEGCVRIQGALGICAINSRGTPTVLETSILDHLEKMDAANLVHGIGPHAGFLREGVRLFVRNLCVDRPPTMDRTESERMGRQVDNIALLVNAATTRLVGIDSGRAMAELANTKQLIQITHEALTSLSAREHVLRMQVREVFNRLCSEVEDSFISLGLTDDQEHRLSHLVQSHGDEVMALLDSGQEAERQLQQVIAGLRGRG